MLNRFAASLFAGLLLAACSTAPPPQKLPQITFGHLPPLVLNNVGRVDVVSEYRPPLKAPHVEHLFPTSPETALKRWAKDRLKPGGGMARARFIIRDASVVEVKLKRKTGFVAAFTKQQSERYDARVEASLEIYDPQGRRRGVASAWASRSRTVREDASLNDREKVWFEMTEALMKDFNREIEKNMRTTLARWVK